MLPPFRPASEPSGAWKAYKEHPVRETKVTGEYLFLVNHLTSYEFVPENTPLMEAKTVRACSGAYPQWRHVIQARSQREDWEA